MHKSHGHTHEINGNVCCLSQGFAANLPEKLLSSFRNLDGVIDYIGERLLRHWYPRRGCWLLLQRTRQHSNHSVTTVARTTQDLRHGIVLESVWLYNISTPNVCASATVRYLETRSHRKNGRLALTRKNQTHMGHRAEEASQTLGGNPSPQNPCVSGPGSFICTFEARGVLKVRKRAGQSPMMSIHPLQPYLCATRISSHK